MHTDLARILDTDREEPPATGDLFDEIRDPNTIAKDHLRIGQSEILRLTGQFWTSGQRQASSLHEVSYRACFKPQLPRYFIRRFTSERDVVYDPFSGRGTTAVEAGLMGRAIIANDVNPLSRVLTEPRLNPPMVSAVEERLSQVKYEKRARADLDLSMFYHLDTESEIIALKQYLAKRRTDGEEDSVDLWIRMVATNRLTGHSPGFFSVYTFPPNQAVSAESQKKINDKRKQTPQYRNTKNIILKKTQSLLSRLTNRDRGNLGTSTKSAQFLTGDARFTTSIANESVQLTVTSPPFLDIVGYASDNWLRCWFNEIGVDEVTATLTMAKTIDQWSLVMADVFKELYRVTRRGGWVAFEVGELRNATLKLEEYVVPLGTQAGFSCEAIVINSQAFTKTSNIWGVRNNKAGTNSNRIVVFRRWQ
jgi:DNA methylase